jgi:hypothetical protein
MGKTYILAKTGPSAYRYELLFKPEDTGRPFILYEGQGVCETGGQYSAADLLKEGFDVLRYTYLDWLEPVLQRIAKGEFPNSDELEHSVVRAYREKVGCDPTELLPGPEPAWQPAERAEITAPPTHTGIRLPGEIAPDK